MYNGTMGIDNQLVADGVKVTDEAISLIMDGTFHSVLPNMGQFSYGQIDDLHEYGTSLPLR